MEYLLLSCHFQLQSDYYEKLLDTASKKPGASDMHVVRDPFSFRTKAFEPPDH